MKKLPDHLTSLSLIFKHFNVRLSHVQPVMDLDALNINFNLQWSHPEKYSMYIHYVELWVTTRAKLSGNKERVRFGGRCSFLT